MGIIPSLENWSLNVDYQLHKYKIEHLTEKDIEISQADIDLAKLQGRNIIEIKMERLKTEKNQQMMELNKKFGIKDNDEIIEEIDEKKKIKTPETKHEELWDILRGKGLVK